MQLKAALGMTAAAEVVLMWARTIEHGAATDVATEIGAELLAVTQNELLAFNVARAEQGTNTCQHKRVQLCKPGTQAFIWPVRGGTVQEGGSGGRLAEAAGAAAGAGFAAVGCKRGRAEAAAGTLQ